MLNKDVWIGSPVIVPGDIGASLSIGDDIKILRVHRHRAHGQPVGRPVRVYPPPRVQALCVDVSFGICTVIPPKDDEFVRSLMDRGMGRWTFHTRVLRSERPNVKVETQDEGESKRTFFHTPVGTVSQSHRQVLREGIIKTVEQICPIIH